MTICVVKHDPNWAKEFEYEAKKILNQLGNIVNHIHHIGSTAVPGLMAKPIIDMLLDVKNLADLDQQNNKLENLGYEVMGEFGILGRRYFRKGSDLRTHHLHAFKAGDSNLIRHLAFRDYLIQHKTVADEYGKLKFHIAKRCNNGIADYCDEKNDFVKYHEAIALEWYQDRKKLKLGVRMM